MDKKSFLISVLTVLVQYYDYHLFGFLAAKIAGHFFPQDDTVVQLLNTYLLMAVAMIAKPVGAVIFGQLGDAHGRTNSFSISLLGTAGASLVLFLTPSYETIGILSAFTLLVSRMAICAFVSSGSDGVRLYIYEHISKKNQCLGVGITAVFTLMGSLIASISAWFFTLNSMPEYSWKFAFLLGGIAGMAIFIIMKITNFSDNQKVSNEPGFAEFKNHSIWQIISENKKLFTLCAIIAGGIGSTNNFILVFWGTYNFEVLKIIDRSLMQNYISYAIILYMIFSIIGGYLADQIGRYRVIFFAGFIAIFLASLQAVMLFNRQFSPVFFFAMISALPFIVMPAAAMIKESIPFALRYRLFSMSHAAGSILISAPTAFIATLLYHKTHIIWLPICYFIFIILVIFLSLGKLNKIIENRK